MAIRSPDRADALALACIPPAPGRAIQTGASYDSLEASLKLFTKESQVKEPRLSKLAQTINREGQDVWRVDTLYGMV